MFYFVEILSINEWNLDSTIIKIIKDQTQKINTFSKSTVETVEQGAICSKLILMTVEG